MAETKKYIKTYCPVSKAYGLITAESSNGSMVITNFYEIDKDTAKSIQTEHTGALPPVSSYLKACASCGSRMAGCCNKKRQCPVPKGELWHQCLYCSAMEICKNESVDSAADIYFLLDQSGSMSADDRGQAVKAVKNMVQSLSGRGNTYSFVAWGSNAGYLFKKEASTVKINLALTAYHTGATPYGGSTAADRAFAEIENDVRHSERPVRIIFVTDGGFDDTEAAVRARNAVLAANKNVEILAIGVTGAIQSALDKIGTVKSFTKVIGSTSALTSTFEEIAKRLKDGGNNF